MSSIVCLITDLGSSDHYPGILKGFLWSNYPELRIVDLMHDIQEFNITAAAFITKISIEKFPEGSVFMVAVSVTGSQKLLVAKYKSRYIIVPDYGLITMILDFPEEPIEVLSLSQMIYHPENENPWQQIENLAFAAGYIAMGGNWTQMGDPCSYEKKFFPLPHFNNQTLHCYIILIDHFGNVTVNLKKSEFPNHGPFTIYVRRHKIPKIHKFFSEITDGECIAYWGNDGYLKIAIRSGSASKLLGLKISDNISIIFNSPPDDNTNRTNAVSS